MDYKEKLEEAKRLYKTANADQKYVLERLFPELKESEDEKIRKEIINYLEPQGDCCGNKERWIAWLEKQVDVKGKLVLTPEAYERILKLNEQKPAWSEDDNIMVHNIDNALRCQITYPISKLQSMSNWILNIKDRVQPKQEWSEEDEYKYNTILHHLYLRKEKYKKECNQEEQDRYQCLYDWFKSLRPQNTWKPSGFHLECISDAIAIYDKRGINAIGLKEILEELKKLKE